MQVRPSRGNGSIVGAALSKTALTNVHATVDSAVKPGMTWEEAGKAMEESLGKVEYASSRDVLELLQKMAAKGLKVGQDESMEKEAQHWLGRGLNWMADVGKGIGQGIGDMAKGVGNWAQDKMQAAQQWQEMQPKMQALRQVLNEIEKNPGSLRQMWPEVIKHMQSLAPKATPQPQAKPQQPSQPMAPSSSRVSPQATPAPTVGPHGVKTLPLPA